MERQQPRQLKETTDIEEANRLLCEGWQLLNTYMGKGGFTYVFLG